MSESDNNNSTKPTTEGSSTTSRNTEFDPQKINEHIKRLTHKLPKDHQPYKVIAGEEDKTETLYKSKLKPKELLYFKNCKNCTYSVQAVCTKVMIEDCENLTITFGEKILTNVMELWKCNNITINVETNIFTVQVDICQNIKLNYSDIDFYHQVVWAGVEDLDIAFQKHPDHNLLTGLVQMKEEYEDLNEEIDQFIIRFVGGKLLSEQIVRLANGYPTTVREADEYDARTQQNEEIAIEHIKQMVSLTPQIGIANIAKKGSDGKKIKVKPNQKCPCGSGLKYKKCCGDASVPSQIAESVRNAKKTGTSNGTNQNSEPGE